MADQTLASMTAASTLTGAELIYLDQASADRKVTTAELKAFSIAGLSTSIGGVPEAPNDGQLYGRQSLNWSTIGAGGGAPSNTVPAMDGIATAGSSAAYARGDHVHPTDTSRAALASPAFTGVPTAPTATAGSTTTQVATTAFVATAVTNIIGGTAATFVPLTDAATVAVNWGAGINYSLTMTASRIIGNPTNGQVGTYRSILVQGNTGTGLTISFGNQFLGTVPSINDCTSTKWYLLTVFCVSTTHFVVASVQAK